MVPATDFLNLSDTDDELKELLIRTLKQFLDDEDYLYYFEEAGVYPILCSNESDDEAEKVK